MNAITHIIGAALLLALASGVAGVTYEVGPGKDYAELQAVAGLLKPGDVVEVAGNATYPGGVTIEASGAPDAKITVRGVTVEGKRPTIAGGLGAVLAVRGSCVVVENVEITAGDAAVGPRCQGFYNVGDDVTLRNCVVHDCPGDGVSGSDASGSLTLDHVEVCHCGKGEQSHQIYVGSNLTTYPHAVFRMRFCYVHDGNGGNNVKSRVTRNEIYYNWISGAYYHELDLIGPDPKGQQGEAAKNAHCDSDVVGNVFVKTVDSRGTLGHLGSDGTGESHGRYRFVNNTVVASAGAGTKLGLFRLKGPMESFEASNNVLCGAGTGPLAAVTVLRIEADCDAKVAEANNWLSEGSEPPSQWKETLTGKSPKLAAVEKWHFWPEFRLNSPLIGAGRLPTAGPEGLAFPSPLAGPEYEPPGPMTFKDAPVKRVVENGKIDIGAFNAKR